MLSIKPTPTSKMCWAPKKEQPKDHILKRITIAEDGCKVHHVAHFVEENQKLTYTEYDKFSGSTHEYYFYSFKDADRWWAAKVKAKKIY